MNYLIPAILSGFALGVVGNIHCLAMCGPLALSLPIHNLSKTKKLKAILLYNIGRTLSYTFLGLLVGVIGSSISLFGLQQWLSIVSGIFLLLFTFSSFFTNFNFKYIDSFKQFIQQRLLKVLQNNSSTNNYLSIGILNGLLPCGLVYMAITTALAIGNLYNSIFVMFAFGVGTFPLMFSIVLFGNNLSVSSRNKFKKVTPVFVSIIACALIIRGLNLNIPFLSPAINVLSRGNVVSCH